MTTNDIDPARIYSRAIADLTSERDEYRDDMVTLTTELADALAELEKVRDQLTAANHRADGLSADLRSVHKVNTAYANENARLRSQLAEQQPVVEAAKAWGEHYGNTSAEYHAAATALAGAVDALKAEVAR